jgi:endo-1,4-beta-xylanase
MPALRTLVFGALSAILTFSFPPARAQSAAMYRNDWSEKPNGKVYRDLVLNQWRTRLIGLTSNNGRYAARGLHGDYVAIVEANGKRVEQPFTIAADAKAPAIIEVRLP